MAPGKLRGLKSAAPNFSHQDRVEIFNPKRVDGSVQDEPDVVDLLHLEGLPPEGREDAVGPVVGGHVQPAKHLTRGDGLKMTHMTMGKVSKSIYRCRWGRLVANKLSNKFPIMDTKPQVWNNWKP